MEKLMGAACYINCYRKSLSSRSFHKVIADLPCGSFIETRELKFVLFLKQLLQYVSHVNILYYWKYSDHRRLVFPIINSTCPVPIPCKSIDFPVDLCTKCSCSCCRHRTKPQAIKRCL